MNMLLERENMLLELMSMLLERDNMLLELMNMLLVFHLTFPDIHAWKNGGIVNPFSQVSPRHLLPPTLIEISFLCAHVCLHALLLKHIYVAFTLSYSLQWELNGNVKGHYCKITVSTQGFCSTESPRWRITTRDDAIKSQIYAYFDATVLLAWILLHDNYLCSF